MSISRRIVPFVLLICVLSSASCSDADGHYDSVTLPQSIEVSATVSDSVSDASGNTINPTQPTKAEIEWNMDNIEVVNYVPKVSIYKVYAEVNRPPIENDKPEGYDIEWCPNIKNLYELGFDNPFILDRETYLATANSSKVCDISSIPQEFVDYADGYDLYPRVTTEIFQYSKTADDVSLGSGWPVDCLDYPLNYYAIRQEIDGIPTMPLRGRISYDSRVSYKPYLDIEGWGWVLPTRYNTLSNGKDAAFYFLIPGLEKKEVIAKDLDVIPFDRLQDRLKDSIRRSIYTEDGIPELKKLKLEDVTVVSAELTYIMICNEYEYWNSSDNIHYLVPFWVIYYNCGLKSGLTQQGAAFIPAVDGVN